MGLWSLGDYSFSVPPAPVCPFPRVGLPAVLQMCAVPAPARPSPRLAYFGGLSLPDVFCHIYVKGNATAAQPAIGVVTSFTLAHPAWVHANFADDKMSPLDWTRLLL